MPRTNWKARALKAEAERDKAEAYCEDYGNANYTCAAGYWQQSGLICHHCGHDDSDGFASRKCPNGKR